MVKTIIGLSNISYGLPERKLINQNFLVLAMTSGLDAAILDSTDKK
jgi:5-methyltetrahydrofolate--homocysteine methyltransferase